MKKSLFFALFVFCFAFVSTSSKAQSKIGHISIQELVNHMPEYKKALADLDEYEKALVQQGQEYQVEYLRQDSVFKADSLKWNEATKEIKRRELNAIYLKVVNFNSEAQKMMGQKETELLTPVQQKAVQTSQQVAKENGYSYILGKEQLIAFPVTDDILPLVLKKLNLAPPATTPAPIKK